VTSTGFPKWTNVIIYFTFY